MSNHSESQHLSYLGGFTLLAVSALTIMVGCVIVPGLHNIASQLHVTTNSSWLITLPSLGVILFGPLAAWLMNKIGLRHALMLGLFLYGLLGSIGVFLSGNISVFIDRILLGGVTAVIMAASTSLISEFYQNEARIAMIAKQGMSIELGGVIFLFIGGILASINWSYPFALYLVAWVLLVFVKMTIPTIKQKIKIKNIPKNQEFISPYIAIIYVAALISMILFFTGIITLPKKIKELGFNEAETGYFLSFVSLVAVVGAATLPKIIRILNEKFVLGLAMFAYAIAHFIFFFSYPTIFIFLGGTMLGIGFGLSIPLITHLTIEHSTESIRARNLAYLSMAVFSGQFLSSFMGYISSQISVIFMAASFIAMVTGLAFTILRLIEKNKKNVI